MRGELRLTGEPNALVSKSGTRFVPCRPAPALAGRWRIVESHPPMDEAPAHESSHVTIEADGATSLAATCKEGPGQCGEGSGVTCVDDGKLLFVSTSSKKSGEMTTRGRLFERVLHAEPIPRVHEGSLLLRDDALIVRLSPATEID